MCDFSTLPAEIPKTEILPRCAEYAPALRAVCQEWRTVVANATVFPKRKTAGLGLSFLAGKEHTPLIVWTKEQRKRDFMRPQLDNMFERACRRGNQPLACLLQEWEAPWTADAIYAAARAGSVGLVFMWRRSFPTGGGWIERAIGGAARGGHYGLVATLGEWADEELETIGKRAYDETILYGAARCGNLPLIRLAESWLPRPIGSRVSQLARVLSRAASGGHLAVMKYLMQTLSWRPHSGVADIYREAIRCAASKGRVDAMELLWSKGEPIIELFLEAGRSGSLATVELLKARGAQNYFDLLQGAVQGGHEHLCRLARTWGAKFRSGDPPFLIEDAASEGWAVLLPMLCDWYLEDGGGSGGLVGVWDDALDLATNGGHFEAAKVLVARGARLRDAHTYPGELAEAISGLTRQGNVAMLTWLREKYSAITLDSMCDDWDLFLSEAAECGEEAVMELFKSWGATNYDIALASAATENQLGAMRLLKSWGASDFIEALELVDLDTAGAQLLTEWQNERDGVAVLWAAEAEAEAELAEGAARELLDSFK